MPRINIRYWREPGNFVNESLSVSESQRERIIEILREYKEPTEVETKSIEDDVFAVIVKRLTWYFAKDLYDEIKTKIKKILQEKTKS